MEPRWRSEGDIVTETQKGSHKKSRVDERRTRTWLLAFTPVAIAAGFVVRPYVSDFTDDKVVAAAIAENTGQWTIAALLMVAAAVVLIFALPAAVRRAGGSERRARWVHTAIIIGTAGFALQVGLTGLGGAAASRMGADVAIFLGSSSGLEGSVLVFGLLALLLAWVGVIRAVWLSELPTSIKWVVIIGAVLGFLGHWYPSSIGEYIASAGTAAALWPLAAYRPTRETAGDTTPKSR